MAYCEWGPYLSEAERMAWRGQVEMCRLEMVQVPFCHLNWGTRWRRFGKTRIYLHFVYKFGESPMVIVMLNVDD